ncbi:MAG TPA: N,N-dimethylformamidase beta subunit family domain-containing protein, partial [Mycobacterium sp.]|nr:N,N-dimethylformamidase beta subunit family domain-containing protein [Mycobacterium sp.]
MIGWGLIAPQPAQAQLLGSLIVNITSPANGSPVSGTVPVSASVTIVGALTVRGVQFKLDGANLGAEDTSAPYSVSWNTTTASNGSHTLTAVATDILGLQFTSQPVTVTVFNDTTPPTVSITAPVSGATVGATTSVTASASDNVGVVGVQFLLDGANLGVEDAAAPYSVSWNTTTASNGSHTLTAVARDAAGNRTTSAPVTVTVFNDTTPPSVTINQAASQADPTNSSPINFTAVFSEPVSGFSGAGVAISGAAGGTKTVTVSGGPSTYNVAVSGMTTTGTVLASIPAGVAQDAAGNLNTASTSTDNSVTFTFVSPVVLENQQPGSGNWPMWLHNIAPADDVGKQIKGYASATSVNKGESITFYVTVNPAQQYTMDVYRMGWYQGLGGRLMQSIGPLQGVAQPACPVDSVTGLIECNWTASYTLTVPATWTSGVFMVQLTNAQGNQNYITFVVRDDARVADIMFQQAVATYQAYNNYPDDGATGKSLYDFNSYGADTVAGPLHPRAVKVSWNRPYTRRGSGDFFTWDYYFVRWLERSGYDVKYSTDVDTHENSARLLNSKAFLSGGHNEYWSKPMYDGVQQARDAGVHLGFFGADAVYWQVRFEPSPLSGAADRVVVGYKDRTIDPVQGPTTTVLWRDPFLNRPEQQLMGVQFSGGQLPDSAPSAPYVVKNSSSWVYAGTGLADGDSIPGIVGYETDASMSGYPLPTSVAGTYQVLSQSPFTDAGGTAMTANSSIYQVPSGAWVFGAGTTGWSLGLDLANVVDPRIQRITANLLNRFLGVSSPAAPTVSITSPASGAAVGGTTSVTATASDNVGVAGVQFRLDGVNAGTEVTAAPYSISWNTTTASNGSHTLIAVARDTAGLLTASAPVTVTVLNNTTLPTISSFTPTGGPVGTSVTISGTNFTGATAVLFNGASAGFTVGSATTITATVPTGASSGPISVTTSAGTASSASSFTVGPSVSPVVLENQQPGSGNWPMWLHNIAPADDVGKQIKGYASATS